MKLTVELWLQGPLEGVPPLLQPAAHALLQAKVEIHQILQAFPETLLWDRPAGLASPAFHLQHMAGVLDRLYTYAAGHKLSDQQLTYLEQEGVYNTELTLGELLDKLDNAVAEAIKKIKQTAPSSLTAWRGVGRAQLPSTVIGLIFHAAEHTMRHTGQLLATVAVLKDSKVE